MGAASPPEPAAGQRDILGLCGQARVERLCLQAHTPLGEGLLDGGADGIGEGTDLGPVLCG